MRTHINNSQNIRVILFLIAFLGSILSYSQYQTPPGYDWKKVDWREKDILNTPGLSQALSGDEWWFSHKNLVDVNNNNKQLGYITVGYLADLMHPGDEPKMRQVFNEGNDSPCNFYPGNGSLFTNLQDNDCSDFVDMTGTGPNVTANERRTEFRGMIARTDKKGKMTWCRMTSIHGDGLLEVIQAGNYVYAIGTHHGAKNMQIANNNANRSFIPYNRTASSSTNFFNAITYSIPQGKSEHMYIVKYDLDGNKQWEGLYGHVSFSNPINAWQAKTFGSDLILNSDGNLYAIGTAHDAGVSKIFLVKIDPANGNLLQETILPLPALANSFSQSCNGIAGRSICELGTTGKMAIGSFALFPGSNYVDFHRAVIHSITQGLVLNSSWPSNVNPRAFAASGGAAQTSNLYELNFHAAKNEVLVSIANNCDNCPWAGSQFGTGQVWRINPSNGSVVSGAGVINPLSLGAVNAFDLRVGAIETSDGGFAAVSSRRNGTFTPFPLQALGVYSTCPGLTSGINGPNYDHTNNPYGFWDTDPLIVKFDQNGIKAWEWSEDIAPGRQRVICPGDFKRQECMYKISEAEDHGLVISGNCSFNHDDDYMVKLYSRCNADQTYVHDGTNLNFGTQTISSSTTIRGKVRINNGEVLTITGPNTKVRFADSKMCGVPTYIEIQPGGKLILQNGAELTSIDNSVCPGSMWDGIAVVGTSSLGQGAWGNYTSIPGQGFLEINGATISNARCAATTGLIGNYYNPGKTGGVIKATDANFINNSRDIQVFSYISPTSPLVNKCSFTRCHFLTTGLLNTEDPPVFHMYLEGLRGPILRGNEFAYTGGNAYDPLERGWGIKSNDASYVVANDCSGPTCIQTEFQELTHGIEADNCNSLVSVSIFDAIFFSSFSSASDHTGGITFHSVYSGIISDCFFTHSDQFAYGISLNNCKNYDINNDTLTSYSFNGVGMYLSNSGSGAHKVYRNTFSNLGAGIIPQFGNSATANNTGDADDGLIMNCNKFVNNIYDIAMMGDNNQAAFTPSVRRNQGNPNLDPAKAVRNVYGAGNTNTNQWHIDYGVKTIIHPGFTQSNTRPFYPAGSQLLFIQNNGQSFNYATDCPVEEPIMVLNGNNNCPCSNCCQGQNINAAFSSAKSEVLTLKGNLESLIDGGDTQKLLDDINGGLVPLQDLQIELMGYSPYLSDTVLKTYIGNPNVTAGDVLVIHDQNKPVTGQVWQVIENRNFSPGELAALSSQQSMQQISEREIKEGELGWAESEMEFIYAKKLNYFLTDTLEGSKDTIVSMLVNNIGGLTDANILRGRAYQLAGFPERAYDYADSLSGIPEYAQIMGLQKVLLQLDASDNGIYTITNSDLQNDITSYASDPSTPGCWLARSVLRQVYGNSMDLPLLYPQAEGEDRQASPGSEAGQASGLPGQPKQNQKLNWNTGDVLKIYPNPTSGNFNLVYNSDAAKDVKYSIRDVLGKELGLGSISPNTTIEINTERYSEGIYFITLMKENKLVEKQKLIIMR